MAESAPNSVAASTPDGIRPRRILIVDDSVAAARMLALLVGRTADHAIETVHTGSEALAAVETFRPDLIFLDLGLAKMSGVEVARQIAESGWGQRAALVAITGHSHTEDRQRTAAAGFAAHLVKPPSLEQIEAALRDIWPARSGPDSGLA